YLKDILVYTTIPYYSNWGYAALLKHDGSISLCTTANNKNEDFRFASLTKLITAKAIVNIFHEKKISLDRKFIDFFSEFENKKYRDNRVKDITINHLLNHSSGLGGPWGADDMIVSKKPWCPSNIINLTQVKIAGKPGSNYLYSNVSYCLLGALINELSIEKDYKKHIEKNYLSKNLYFLDNNFRSDEAPYNTKYDVLFNLNYINQINFDFLASSAGLAGSSHSFLSLIQSLYSKSDLEFLFKRLESQCTTNLNNCYLWNFRLMKKDSNYKIIFS